MNLFCHDRDLLLAEPSVFTALDFKAQRLAAGVSGTAAGTTFLSPELDFTATGVMPGMVLCIHAGEVSEGACYEIVSVDSIHTLTLSVPRASSDDPTVAPLLTAQAMKWQVLSLTPQIAAASADLAERLRTLAESLGVRQGDFADSAQLRATAVCATLANIYAAAAETADDSDARWTKHRRWAEAFQSSLMSLRLTLDVNGDGVAERTRTLSHVQLRRL
jgi:hypothetical protein